jgi:hypothetical protein
VSDLEEINKLAKCGVFVSINEHKDYYQKIEKALEELDLDPGELDEETKQEIIKRDNLVVVQVYPITPIGFVRSYHWSADEAIKEMLEYMRERESNATQA